MSRTGTVHQVQGGTTHHQRSRDFWRTLKIYHRRRELHVRLREQPLYGRNLHLQGRLAADPSPRPDAGRVLACHAIQIFDSVDITADWRKLFYGKMVQLARRTHLKRRPVILSPYENLDDKVNIKDVKDEKLPDISILLETLCFQNDHRAVLQKEHFPIQGKMVRSRGIQLRGWHVGQ